LAAEIAMQHGDRQAAVIGCGTVGLTTARQLQRRGFDVTIYAKSIPPDTTSNKALAGFTPTSGLVDRDQRTPEWDAQFRRAAEISYEQLQLLVGRPYGVSWINSYGMLSELPAVPEERSLSPLLPAALQTGEVVLQPGEHPFPSRFATRTSWLVIEPAIYLKALVRDVLLFGGRIVICQFATSRDLLSLRESLIVNCTGLGAREFFKDDDLIPVKGQLTMLVPQPEVDYATSGGVPGSSIARGGFIHMAPRSDGIALGGTAERGVWDLEPNEAARRRIVESHIELYRAMRARMTFA
jgi:glycine/D-amino acid oxidase-like deaminating enzyme